MSYQAAILTALTTANLAGGRVFADVADGTTAAPYIVYQTLGTGGSTTHDGTRGVEFPEVQFSCWATTKAAAISLADSVVSLLEGQTLSGSAAPSFQFSNRLGTYEADTKLFGELVTFRVSSNT